MATGLLQKEAAAILGVSAHHLKMIELGKRESKSLSERAYRLLSNRAS
jgi:transcriptional regulator with XRE-family HTH domain